MSETVPDVRILAQSTRHGENRSKAGGIEDRGISVTSPGPRDTMSKKCCGKLPANDELGGRSMRSIQTRFDMWAIVLLTLTVAAAADESWP